MRICIVTSTRADWGLLTPLAATLRDNPAVTLQIVATNMHLSERCGLTAAEITAAGFEIDARVPTDNGGDTGADKARVMAATTAGMADAFAALQPDAVIILGDRYEMLGVASAATVMRIPIIHIAGGTVSEGAIDDSIRHAITKLASLHLCETDEARARIIQMGEEPENVITTGALGVWNIMHQPLLTQKDLEESLGGFTLDPRTSLLVTYHPATLDDRDPRLAVYELLAALDRFPDSHIIITHPNNDAGGEAIAELIEDYARANADHVLAVTSLGMKRYLSALRCVGAVVGNSSSGIVEVPSMHVCTVDIGIRQAGRLCARSVLHCPDNADDIAACIGYALSPDGRRLARDAENPYYKPDTVRIMTQAILDFMPRRNRSKRFNMLKISR